MTRETPTDPRFRAGRIDAGLIGEVLAGLGGIPRHIYACGSNAFVDASTQLLLDMGVPFEAIRTERYGGEPAPAAAGVRCRRSRLTASGWGQAAPWRRARQNGPTAGP